MKVIYENEIKGLGACVDEFAGGNMFIIFGEGAPDELKDYCYLVSVNPINGTIAAGQILKIDDKEYKITAVGKEAPVTLAGLGHMTINMSGKTTAELPGTLYTEEADIPPMDVGTKISIIEP
ncbi:MAG: PTS glucitol/sorbitol transporter subunit IIA [Lachnospiraceae bacterium]|nr:PTS glucitol/sorbitol transporter subunit IIA [Lachnospiraceae bacterium]